MRGSRTLEFNLSQQTRNEKAYRVINIVQMLDIDVEMEKFIHATSVKAKDNHEYVFKGYLVDENVESMAPEHFYSYYRKKQLAYAQSRIKELEVD